MNILLLGHGGREHALAWVLRRSPRLGSLWVADGRGRPVANAGLRASCLAAPPEETDLANAFRMQRWCDRESIDLVVVGPEALLADGAADLLGTPQRPVFGPTKAGARIESDKAFAKQIMRSASIPTADAREFSDPEAAARYVEAKGGPSVVKAVGLASGKGVIVCDTPEEALAAIDRVLVRRVFGSAGEKILIEERLQGPEVSVLALVDGSTIWVLDPCQDHKRLLDGDLGPNTGGMGAYCPAPILDATGMTRVQSEILVPVVDALSRQGVAYRGVLYAGLMVTPAGPKVLEFNCRFGDPECQALMLRLRCDLAEVLWATATGRLDEVALEFDPRHACCVVMAAAGYPDAPQEGAVIEGLADAASCAGPGQELQLFHAATSTHPDGTIRVTGGRVLGVTALADSLAEARELASRACRTVRFAGAQWRRDIGRRNVPGSPQRT
jgi:phosphoribosylamine--glycine ligase